MNKHTQSLKAVMTERLFFWRLRKGRFKWRFMKPLCWDHPVRSNAEGMQKSRFLISCYSCLEEYKSKSWSVLHSACSLRISACWGMTSINLTLQHQDTSLYLPVLVPDFHYTAKPALSRNSVETTFPRKVKWISEVKMACRWEGRYCGQLYTRTSFVLTHAAPVGLATFYTKHSLANRGV
jgi:hypothetical protein